MLAVAATHISFQNHRSLRGPALPPPPGMLAPLPGVGILLVPSSALHGSHTFCPPQAGYTTNLPEKVDVANLR
ncbi:hypothetical protein MC885_006195, partial [Smutsia gigantea]